MKASGAGERMGRQNEQKGKRIQDMDNSVVIVGGGVYKGTKRDCKKLEKD